MTKIIGLFPLTGNGGIASWTKKFLKTFPDEEFEITPINVSSDRENDNFLTRVCSGIRSVQRIKKDLLTLLKKEHFDILHTTTSGNIGSYRDYAVAKVCKQFGVKTIMHCRYGCIPEDINSKGLVGILTRRAMRLFDQIWVLDSRSYTALEKIPYLKGKIYLTPNSIDVQEAKDLNKKSYNRILFVGNLIPTKGIYELVDAVNNCDIRLDIIGPGTDEVNSCIRKIAGDNLDKKIFLHGKLPNDEAVQFMKDVDIVALPTYFPWEAFPISIIEAMSLTKMVISCPRAAIPDMLNGLDSTPCGILVSPKSPDEIKSAIEWCQLNKEEADNMCSKAYDKVYNCYRKEVVYEIYRRNYRAISLP